MDLLLDTHAFIWFLNGDSQLPAAIKNLIADTSNKCFLSIGSIWEIAIKVSLNKLELQGDFNHIAGFLIDNDIEVLPITFEHIQRLLRLEFHHRDPFDRIIIAQALTENLTLATKDGIFYKYGVNITWT
ncbi:type II toxin-antitoxin system VapC family toxin [Ilyomonas limi]|uniref:Type II toxin-antitoxin system VapC family toxin n=1 Tax=Ilyomonas limi TaxID=2575867 RepID=A0A4U3KPL1_9BACT|nr:type II toxin-antitoxin system VapC family toxin [Ilyomonas limi]TKK64138.1 type II toxin-antitoxin system VapC family toxin [Ilyomonas limi]